MSNTTPAAGQSSLEARKAARAKRIAKAQMIEDVADAKAMLQDARDKGITVEDANYLRGLVESILEATQIEEDGTPSVEALNVGESITEKINGEDVTTTRVAPSKSK